MDAKNFTTTILVDKTPKEVFNAINNVRGWWSENIDGNTDKLDAEFLYRYKDVHICKIKIVQFIPEKKVAWLVLENHFNFTKDQGEWKGNKIIFEISEKDNQTQINFTQIGLTSEYECYNVCQDAWTGYIQGSLKDLASIGKGKPNTKEDDSLNKELLKKWGLPKK
ncbi:MAG: SRPBCC domain-containing protein [Bacteroidetes bacterium]|nr:SRPBCC domain-containing protein [Bacteroidota bacterium]